MSRQHAETTYTDHSRDEFGVREMTASMLRFTNAVTLFSMQQVQNALGAMTDSQAAINQFCDTLDSLSRALSGRIDDSKKSTLDRMTKTGADIVDRTFETFNAPALDPREVIQTTTDMMRKTTDSVADMMRRSDRERASSDRERATSEKAERDAARDRAAGSSEPQSAAEALGTGRKK